MKRRWLYLLFIMLPTALLLGQRDTSLDKANHLFQNYKFKESTASYKLYFDVNGMECENRTTAHSLFQYGQALIYSKDNSGHETLALAENCAKTFGSDSLYAYFLSVHGEIYKFSHQFDLVKPYLWKINKLPKITPTQRARNFAELAIVSREENNDSTTLYANRALEIGLAENDTATILQSYTALGLKKVNTNQLHEAIHWNTESLKYQKGNFSQKKSETFGILANLFTTLKDYPKANKYVDSVYQTIDTSVYQTFTGSVIYTQGRILTGQNRLKAAKEKFKISISKLKNFKNNLTARIALIECLIALKEFNELHLELVSTISYIEAKNDVTHHRKLYYLKSLQALHKNDHHEAIAQAHKGLSIKTNNLLQNYGYELNEILATSYEQIGNVAESLKFYKIHYAEKDSADNRYDNSLVYTLENEFIASEQDKQLAQLETQQALQEVKFKQQRWQGLSLIGFLLLLGITIFSLTAQHRKIKNQTQTIENSIEEKNILLKEIHHRVKNNLQVITSLFKLQSRYIKDDSAMEALNEGRNRVNSLAILHQNLYQEDNLKGVRMDNYIEQLCDALFANSKIENKNIVYKNHSAGLILDIDTVIPIGLILTELISSALKNQYPEKGEICIFLEEENDLLILVVTNNGSSLNKSEEAGFLNSFSQKIIQAFAKKLKAEFSTNNTDIQQVTLKSKNYKKAI